eukprot:8190451-Ditylum_brightwellii.AAC.1
MALLEPTRIVAIHTPSIKLHKNNFTTGHEHHAQEIIYSIVNNHNAPTLLPSQHREVALDKGT